MRSIVILIAFMLAMLVPAAFADSTAAVLDGLNPMHRTGCFASDGSLITIAPQEVWGDVAATQQWCDAQGY